MGLQTQTLDATELQQLVTAIGEEILTAGARGIDMVINARALRSGDYDTA